MLSKLLAIAALAALPTVSGIKMLPPSPFRGNPTTGGGSETIETGCENGMLGCAKNPNANGA